ncbi:acyltransferase [Paraburkholderia sp. MMS20-SJTR3]|uniref:Acyltransferase n=1 Tax=Paraburkholderia sejongensis TaxID=2886946 RepID=A0ABS8K5M9_9BURK|nr:acyltransferase [Paraburkholderia sp. MMS20-SJTR3]MCC8397472.1 acyltransferase [Paraburkholderia sp. MMS20-SJTR3]
MTNHNQKFEILDGLRGIAAISVMLMHFLQDLSIPMLQSAYLSVDIFFIISGFILTHSYGEKLSKESWKVEYLKRRLIRLYPMVFIGLTIGVVSLIVMKINENTTLSLGNLASASGQNYLLIPYLGHFSVAGFVDTVNQNLPTNNDPGLFPLNPPVWSLFFEMFASVILIAAIRLGEQQLLRMAYACLIAFVIYGILININDHKMAMNFNQGWSADNFIGGFFRVGYGFSLGVIIRKMYDTKIPAKPHWFLVRFIKNDKILFLAFLLIVAFPTSIKGTYSLAVLLFMAPALVYRGAMLNPSEKIIAKICSFLGWLSYPLYCVHFPIGRLVFAYIPHSDLHIVRTAMFAACLSIATAALLAKFVEEPIRAHLNKRLFRKHQAAPGRPVNAA